MTASLGATPTLGLSEAEVGLQREGKVGEHSDIELAQPERCG